ncbi:MAG TPA: DUF427 domain-containing protein [Rhodobacteraceae bacterium]|nr:DUF427 domain-containing protein [Paracoccaceae bacterium]
MSEHIRIHKAEGKWVVRAGGAILGESRQALELVEGDQKPVIYFPRDDIATAFLDESDLSSRCPHKGNAHYYSIQTKNRVLENAVWSYPSPAKPAAQIKDYLAFDPAQVTVEEL